MNLSSLNQTNHNRELSSYIAELLLKAEIVDEELERQVSRALLRIDRGAFYAKLGSELIYSDQELQLPDHRVSVAPSLFLRLLAASGLKTRGTSLVLGGEFGYYAALLHALGQYVYAVDESNSFTQTARKLLDSQDMMSVLLKSGRVAHGWKDHAPYDSIFALIPTADHIGMGVTDELAEQLAVGGVYAGWSLSDTLGGNVHPGGSQDFSVVASQKIEVLIATKTEDGTLESYRCPCFL